jgi:hypothetical protein
MLIVKLMNVNFTSRTKLHHHLAQVYFRLLLDVPVPLNFATLTYLLASECRLNESIVRLCLICEMLALSVLNQLKII